MASVKLNKAKIRRDISATLANQFINSGKKYTCIACVFDLRPVAIVFANELLTKGINLSKSNYPFAYSGLMADMFLMDAAKIVHKHFYPS
jgi:hypothetical protein